MTTKRKAKTRARTKKAPAAEAQPAQQTAAPEPQPVALDVVERPGLRTPEVWSTRDRCPRPAGPETRTATLVRGTSWRISYSRPGPLVFEKGVAVRINDVEFANLSGAIDRIDYEDQGRGVRVEQRIRKFIFHDVQSGDQIEMPALPDRDVGPYAATLAEEDARRRKFEGTQYTAR